MIEVTAPTGITICSHSTHMNYKTIFNLVIHGTHINKFKAHIYE